MNYQIRPDGRVSEALQAARFGRLDILVNNAGIAPGNPAEDVREEDLDATLAVYVKGTFLASQAAGRIMMRQGPDGSSASAPRPARSRCPESPSTA